MHLPSFSFCKGREFSHPPHFLHSTSLLPFPHLSQGLISGSNLQRSAGRHRQGASAAAAAVRGAGSATGAQIQIPPRGPPAHQPYRQARVVPGPHHEPIAAYAASFLPTVVQPILAASADPLVRPRDAVVEFVAALLPIVRRKARRLLPLIVDQAPLLTHLAHEMIKFDAELRDDFGYSPFGAGGVVWKGLAHDLLVVDGGFGGWLRVEKEYTFSSCPLSLSLTPSLRLPPPLPLLPRLFLFFFALP